jgi:hypothetical protein
MDLKKYFYIGSDNKQTKCNFNIQHYVFLDKILFENKSILAKELLAGLSFVVTGNSDYLLLDKEK